MKQIQPRLERVTEFTVAGLSVRTKNDDEFNPKTAKIPQLWDRFRREQIAPQAPRIFGVYSKFESDMMGAYTLTAGIKVEGQKIPPGFEPVTVNTGDYLVFENTGPMPHAVIEIWQNIWQYFQDQPMSPRDYQTDFEMYNGPEHCAIYIGVQGVR